MGHVAIALADGLDATAMGLFSFKHLQAIERGDKILTPEATDFAAVWTKF